MKLIKFIIIFTSILILYSCANYKSIQKEKKIEKTYYSSIGFALIYDDYIVEQKVINKKLNNNEIKVLHSSLKKNTPIKIINPINNKSLETIVYKTVKYPSIFNIVITKKIASILEIDNDEPYIEIYELKKNKTFVAKKSNTFEEEKNVAGKAPIDEIQMNDLSVKKIDTKQKQINKSKFIIVISDFYYLESANVLKEELVKKTNIKGFSVKKVANNKFRLSIGPFKNFNSLKSIYISLNNLGFEGINIYKE